MLTILIIAMKLITIGGTAYIISHRNAFRIESGLSSLIVPNMCLPRYIYIIYIYIYPLHISKASASNNDFICLIFNRCFTAREHIIYMIITDNCNNKSSIRNCSARYHNIIHRPKTIK